MRIYTIGIGLLLVLLLGIDHSQTYSVVRGQELLLGAKAQVAHVPRATAVDGVELPELSSVDILSLVSDSDRLGSDMHLRLPEYTYLKSRVSRELDLRGKLVQHVNAYEAYPIKVLSAHRHVISLISENGVTISRKRLQKERQLAVKAMEAAEYENAQQASSALMPNAEKYVTVGIGVNEIGNGVWVGVSQFLRQCRFGAPRFDRLADRKMIALNIHSCNSNLADPREQYLTSMAGVLWIDAADKVVARLEAWQATRTQQDMDTPGMRPETETLVYEQMRLPNGLWVPKRIRLNAIGKAAL